MKDRRKIVEVCFELKDEVAYNRQATIFRQLGYFTKKTLLFHYLIYYTQFV